MSQAVSAVVPEFRVGQTVYWYHRGMYCWGAVAEILPKTKTLFVRLWGKAPLVVVKQEEVR